LGKQKKNNKKGARQVEIPYPNELNKGGAALLFPSSP